VLVIHHEGKDKSKGGLGSMVLEAAVDGLAKLSREGNRRIFSVVFLREANDDQPNMIFELERVTLKTDFDGAEGVESAVLKLTATKAKRSELNATDRLLLAIYRVAKPNRADLAAALGNTPTAISHLTTGLRKLGYLSDKGLALTNHGIERAELLSETE